MAFSAMGFLQQPVLENVWNQRAAHPDHREKNDLQFQSQSGEGFQPNTENSQLVHPTA